MKLKVFKNIIIFGAAWIFFFFATEFLMNLLFEDETPFWKILAISVISGVTVCYPYLKYGRDFSLDQVKKNQRRTIPINKEVSRASLNEKISKQLTLKKYRIVYSDLHKIELKPKWHLNSIGEKYGIQIADDEIIIESKPKTTIFPFDSGSYCEQINLIKKEIINVCQ